jgi:hypothetical protein
MLQFNIAMTSRIGMSHSARESIADIPAYGFAAEEIAKKVVSHWKRERRSLERMNICLNEIFEDQASMNESYSEMLEANLEMKGY